ncbi:MAG: EamA-like transporter family, partial [Pseudomonadota bacterium]
LLLGATAATYLLNSWALQRVRPSLVGGFVCLQTVFGLAFSGVILHETLTPLMLLGSILILGGVVLLSFAAWVKGSVGFTARDDSTPAV